ncbi:vitelline membrane outer layer protein 1-like [Panulirus ornatus]|uniref:vitelline membrane outer layer protein 1-like n=1 Tax=Panulirus ornatus TaxID=150431 RepID=UPI003A89C2E2
MKIAALLSFLACCLLAAADSTTTALPQREAWRNTTAELFLNNGVAWGLWGPVEFCEAGSFAHAFEVKYEKYSSTDDTAVNGVKLYCGTTSDHDTGYVTSTVGQYGNWQGMRVCDKGFLTGMRANVLESQGLLHDDVAVENVEMRCAASNETIIGVQATEKFPLGKWSVWSECPIGSMVCGLKLRYENPVLTADDAGTTDILMYCCDY